MAEDERDRPRSTTPGRPDASFIRRLEDDSLWQESPRPVRRTDRYADRAGGRRTSRSSDSRYERTAPAKRMPPRSRRAAVIVLVILVIVLVIAGLELTDSAASSGSTPFSLLPLEPNGVTATTNNAEAASSDTSSSAPATTTSTTVEP